MTRDEPSDFGVIRYWYTTLSPYPMKPNVHEYPEHANERELLQYKIAVEQAALDGKPIEITEVDLDDWHPYRQSCVGLPLFRWDMWHYRVARPKVAEGHNPDKLTEEQVGVADGWRLLTAEEIKGPKCPGVEYLFVPGNWQEAGITGPHRSHNTYRTKAAPGHYVPKPVQPTTVLGWLNLLPDGYRERALKNRRPEEDDVECAQLWGAVLRLPWRPSPEGTEFWSAVYDAVTSGKEYPPLPDAPKKVVPWSLDNFVWPDCVRRHFGGLVYGVQLADPTGLFIGFHDSNCASKTHEPIGWQTLADDFEYSTDNGKSWRPCCRTEDAS
jgi:hypothetical protein